jgi:hypothetical protein
MSCPHGNPIGDCDICDEIDAAFEAGRQAALAEQEPLGYIATMALNDLQASIYRDVTVYSEDLEDTVAIYATPQAQRYAITAIIKGEKA